MTNRERLSHISRNAMQWMVWLVLLGVLVACGGGSPSQSTDTQANTQAVGAEVATTATVPVTTEQSTLGLPLFITPRPVRAEEPLTGTGRDMPSVFEGITAYRAIQATVATEPIPPPSATTLAEAAKAVVKILRCDNSLAVRRRWAVV